jgi:hypothetical protein
LDSVGSPKSRVTRWPGALALLVLTAMLRAPSFARVYLSDDEAIYAVIGRAFASGARLYVDVVDHKPPAIYWLYGAVQSMVGDATAMTILHVLLLIGVWATAMTVGAIARRCAPNTPNVDRVAALLYVVFTTTMMGFDSLAANCELWMMLPASVAVLLVLDPTVTASRAALAGVLLSIAGAFKYQAAVETPVLLGLLVLTAAGTGDRVRRTAAAFVGLCLPWAAMIAWFSSRGDLGEALYWFRFNFAYIDAGFEPVEAFLRALPRVSFAVMPAALLYVAATAGALQALRDRDRVGRWMVAWAVLSAVAVAAGGRFFGHYFHQLTAPLAVLAAPIVAGFAERRFRTTVFGLAFPALGFWVVAWWQDAVRLRVTGYREPNYGAVVRWLDARDPARNTMCVWGNSPLLVAQAQRPLGCRFVFANYQSGLSPGTRTETDPSVDATQNVYEGAWPRLLSDLETRRPEFIVDGSPGNIASYGKFPPERYAELWAVLMKHYETAGSVEGMRVFRRRH